MAVFEAQSHAALLTCFADDELLRVGGVHLLAGRARLNRICRCLPQGAESVRRCLPHEAGGLLDDEATHEQAQRDDCAHKAAVSVVWVGRGPGVRTVKLADRRTIVALCVLLPPASDRDGRDTRRRTGKTL